jgi:hypothetical protein
VVNKQKQKGDAWERQVVDILNKRVKKSTWKRIVGSGSIGTLMNEPLLTGDIKGDIQSFYKKWRGECKTGYGGEKQFTLKKEWIDKINEEADLSNSIPFLVGKFLGAKIGAKHFVVLDLETFITLLNEYTELKEDYDKVFEVKNG